jgi:AcrR family transcriptional regulator
VVESVLDLIDREPGEAVTIARAAAEVGASPAALYRHFENLDDLLDSVVASVLADVDAGLDVDAPWERQLGDWMRALRAQLLRVPAVLTLIGRTGRTSPSWLNASSVLLEILDRAGLAGDPLAVTYLWILETTTGLVLQEAALPVSDQLANARASTNALSDDAAARFGAVSPALEAIDGDRFFSFVVEQAISVVSSQRSESARG